MRIVSEFHDFYDTVQATGQDQTLVYLRTRKEVKLEHNSFPFPVFEGRYWDWCHKGVPVVQIVVGFCGKVYPILQLSHQRLSQPIPSTALCYTLSEVDTFIEHHFKQREIETYRSKPRRWGLAGNWPREQRRENFEEFFDSYAAKQSAFGHLFVDNRCPILVASTWMGRRNREYKIVYNECLKELEFFRIMNTFTAYQELQMYFGAMAQPNKPIPDISDKDMVSIKGFDKWSFRKPPKSLG
jgi:hypothetical protein